MATSSVVWWALLLAGIGSGLALWPQWRAGNIAPPQKLVLIHGAAAGVLLTCLALLYRREGPWSNPEVMAVVGVIASGAMLFGARQKQAEFPRLVMLVHWLSALALIGLAVSP